MSEENPRLLHGHCDEAEQIVKAFGLGGNVVSLDFHLDSTGMATVKVEQEVPASVAEPLARVLKKYKLVEID